MTSPGWPFVGASDAEAFIGRSLADACQLAEDQDIAVIRVLSATAGAPFGITMDQVPERLNLLVRDGEVVQAGFF